MAVPKKRTSSARRDKRRAQHDKLAPHNVIGCPQCGAPKLSHRMCGECGWYRNRTVVQFVDPTPPETPGTTEGDGGGEAAA